MYTLCIVLVLIASLLLVLAVLVQSPKSGMAANFGASNQVMGVRQTTDFLEKLTWGMAVAIFVLSLLATLAMDTKPAQSPAAAEASALVEEMAAPAEDVVVPQVEVPAEAPAQTPAE
ncbi:MAG: preprotein translocase subunit SecG [Alistipes sp.]|nr:preprotein translocase subunit SecG [Alistipes sp.]